MWPWFFLTKNITKGRWGRKFNCKIVLKQLSKYENTIFITCKFITWKLYKNYCNSIKSYSIPIGQKYTYSDYKTTFDTNSAGKNNSSILHW